MAFDGFQETHNPLSQSGGFRLVIEYSKLGVFDTAANGFIRCLIKRRSFKAIYPEVLKLVELPVIITPVGGVPDVAVDGENMLLFEPGDVDALAEKLEMVMSDYDLRVKLAKESSKLAKDKFSLGTVTEQVAEIYEELK